jgi:NADH:ubiquinone oxidoreductase subunit 5 (subunit L)/multisubunit Na+/H+ antiporter MnhA subunit
MNSVLLAIVIPLLGAFLIPFLPKRFKPVVSVCILGITFLISVTALPVVIKYGEIFLQKKVNEWFNLTFVIDGLSAIMAVVSSCVAFLIALYSLEYMKDYEERGIFYFWMVLFVGAMMGLIFSANLLLLYCFWEITAVCSWKLIGFYRQEKDLKAADRAFLVTFFGASLLLAGIVFVFFSYGSLDLYFLKGKTLPFITSILLLAGIISKSAQLPFQTWLPDAGVAPTPVTALLHAAVLVKIGVYVFARLFAQTFLAQPAFLAAVITLSIATIIVGAASALVENNLKRILAYSTISQLGYILLALAINTKFMLVIALLYILAHSLGKAGLFLCAGIIEQKTHTKNISELGGLYKTMPLTAAAYLMCTFSIIGLPPFLGFWPKFMTVLFTVKEGYVIAGILALVGALATLLYLVRLFNFVFLGEMKIKAEEGKRSVMVFVVMVLGVASLLLGLVVKLPFGLIARLIQ